MEVTSPSKFDEMYLASLPQELLDLYKNPDYFRALELAKAGFKVDGPIMINKISSPYIIMLARKTAGYAWVPKFDQPPVLVGPGLSFPGLPVYDPKNPPAGAIKVSLDDADYPPRMKPEIVAPTDKPMVGSLAGGNVYNSGPGDNKTIPNGYLCETDPRGKFVKHVVAMGGFGDGAFWQKL